ncbi:hypothetical protein HDU78_003653 [Chytriomyces hyalinus]|nr:hypothetical protein HDU78_003653 [Chytriomyces hyalinus]
MWAAPPATRAAATFEGDNISDFIYWVEKVTGLQPIVPVAQYNFIKAHFSKTVKQEHDSWIVKEKAKAEKVGTLYIAKDIDDLHAWLETMHQLRDSKVTITNLHTLIEQVKGCGYVNLLSYQSEFKDIVSRMLSSAKPDGHTLIKLFLQSCLPDDRKELVKYSMDSLRVPVMDFNKFLDHMDMQDYHNQMQGLLVGAQQ